MDIAYKNINAANIAQPMAVAPLDAVALHPRVVMVLLAMMAWTSISCAGDGYDPNLPQELSLRAVATGLDGAIAGSTQIFPTDLAAFPDGSGRLLISTLGGPIRLLNNGLAETVFINTESAVTLNADNGNSSYGLTTIAFHPDFANSASPGYQRIYTVEPEITQSNPPPDFAGIRPDVVGGSNPAHDRVLYEYQMDNIADNTFTGNKREVMRIHKHRRGHDVNDLSFDQDGYLFIAVGDTVVDASAQELNNIFGTVLKIDPLPPTSQPASTDPISDNGSYRVPSNNPFINQSDAIDEIYAYGLRNPFRIHVDVASNELWVSSNGQGTIESVYRVSNGDNLGWPFFEGSNSRGGAPSGFQFTPPVFEYPHSMGLSITGVVRYRGTQLPQLSGQVIFSDFLGPGAMGARVFYGNPDTGAFADLEVTPDVPLPATIVSIGLDDEGEMYFLSGDGQVLTTTAPGIVFSDSFETL